MTTLAMFLGRGGNVVGLDRWECLIESAVEALTVAPSIRRCSAVTAQRCAVSVDDGHLARFFRWQAEMCDDPALARRLLESLPEPERSRAFADLDMTRRAHPIDVVVPVMDEAIPWSERTWFLSWHCRNCGDAHDVGDGVPVVVIGYRPGWSRLDDDAALTYCAGCIGIAAGAGGLADPASTRPTPPGRARSGGSGQS